jgi:hypothetical protein
MRLFTIAVLCAVATLGLAQTKTETLTIITATSAAHSQYPKHIRAVLSAKDDSVHIDTRKIKFHPGPVKFAFEGQDGLLTWFSYTNPPRDRKRVFIEADQTAFGALLYRSTLYVCSPDRPQESMPVINALLASATASPLSETDAQSISLLTAKCSDALEIYGDPQSSSESAQRRLQKVASPPITTTANGEIKVVFYSWSALPDDAISKWTFRFRANRLLSLDRIALSESPQ